MQIPVLDYQKFAKLSAGGLIFGVIYGFLLFPNILRFVIKYQVQLRPGSRTREKLYLPIPFDIEFSIFVWNLTNPDEVQAGGVPKMQEIGPYIFLERKLKYDVEDDDEMDTMTFDQKNTFYFLPNKTLPLTGKEIITIPHLVIQMGLLMVQRDQEPLLPIVVKGLNELFDDPKTPFLTETVADLLFDGVPIDCDKQGFEAKSICSALEDTLGESSILNETHLAISLFRAQNDTSSGRFTVYRGMKNISDVGRMVMFNDEPELDVFDGEECNELRGTDSLFYPPFLEKDQLIWGFSAQLCRSIKLWYKKESSYRGVALKRFSTIFNKDDPDCFCRDPDECYPFGTMDLSLCLQAPLVLSKPHFLDADLIIHEKVKGMTPNETNHDIIVDFELFAGAPLNARSAAQFSLDMTSVESFEPMSQLPTVFLPIFYVTESIALGNPFILQFKALHIAQYFSSFIKYICIIFGFLGTGAFSYLAMNRNSSETPVDEEVIVERGTDGSTMYPEETNESDFNPMEMIGKAGAGIRDKFASALGFSDSEDEKK